MGIQHHQSFSVTNAPFYLFSLYFIFGGLALFLLCVHFLLIHSLSFFSLSHSHTPVCLQTLTPPRALTVPRDSHSLRHPVHLSTPGVRQFLNITFAHSKDVGSCSSRLLHCQFVGFEFGVDLFNQTRPELNFRLLPELAFFILRSRFCLQFLRL